MKNKVFAFGLLLTFGIVLQSFVGSKNTFKIIGKAKLVERISAAEKLDISQIEFKNTSKKAIKLKWTTLENTFPETWDYSMCAYGFCQIGIPEKGNMKELAAGSTGFIAVHVLPAKHKGEGTVKFKVSNINDDSDFEIIEFQIIAE